LARNGFYAQLWNKQQGFALNDDGSRAAVTVDRLRRLPLLQNLEESVLGDIAGLFVTEQYPEGRVIVHEGDPGVRFYIIVRGTVSVRKADAAGEDKEVAVLQDGDYFGEIALIRNVPRTATCVAVTPCVCLSLQQEQFALLLSKSASVRETVERSLRERLGAPGSAS